MTEVAPPDPHALPGEVPAHWPDLDSRVEPRALEASVFPLEENRRRHAFHESGHALVGMRFGLRLDRVRLLEVHVSHPQQGILTSGVTTWGPSAWIGGHRFAVQCAAGSAAERRFAAEAGLLAPGNGHLFTHRHDRETAAAVLAQYGCVLVAEGPAPAHGATWHEATGEAEGLIDDLWPSLTTAAQALLAAEEGFLTGDQVAALPGITNVLQSPDRTNMATADLD
jgi:hypothetical protein